MRWLGWIVLMLTATHPCMECHDDLWQPPVRHEVLEECDTCHEDQGEHTFAPLTDEDVLDICTTCHDVELRHPPDGGVCTDCHDPHATQEASLLAAAVPELCADCHDIETRPTALNHPPYAEGDCTACHAPHGSEHPAFLADAEPGVCTDCHMAIDDALNEPVIHPPARERCTRCHQPHTADFPKLLKYFLTTRFYETYVPVRYWLCFRCHPVQKVFGPESRFVRGKKNLHRVHVQRPRGRACRVCHRPHGSTQPGLLRERIPFGPYWYIPLHIETTDRGKACAPACHQREEYGR